MADVAEKLSWRRIRTDDDLCGIARFVRKQSVNTYSGPRQDRRGDWIILLGWDDRPDADFGRFRGNRAAVWFASEDLARRGEAEVRSGLGWSPTP